MLTQMHEKFLSWPVSSIRQDRHVCFQTCKRYQLALSESTNVTGRQTDVMLEA